MLTVFDTTTLIFIRIYKAVYMNEDTRKTPQFRFKHQRMKRPLKKNEDGREKHTDRERITKLNTYSLVIHTTALIHTVYTTLCPDLRPLRLHRRVGIYWYRAQGRRRHTPAGEGAS